ncbi:MAG TPA: hypothetical protein VL069_03480 [Opitutus sp.]|nr:hypothetical protein [Opitutus sp.]
MPLRLFLAGGEARESRLKAPEDVMRKMPIASPNDSYADPVEYRDDAKGFAYRNDAAVKRTRSERQ